MCTNTLCSIIQSLYARISVVWGIEIEPIVLLSPVLMLETWSDGRILAFILDFISRHRRYVLGINHLQAFFRLVGRGQLLKVGRMTVLRALTFLSFLVWSSAEDKAELMLRNLEKLGFSSKNLHQEFPLMFFQKRELVREAMRG